MRCLPRTNSATGTSVTSAPFKEGSARSEEQIFDELLREGGTSAHASAFHIFFGSEFDGVPIEAMVLVETRVLSGDDSVLEIR